MKRLLVLGFYDRHNLGDDMFKETIPLLVPDFKCDFISTDDFNSDTNIYDGIICGGGDIFNEYFMSKIKTILTKSTNLQGKPVYILGMGIPYPSMFETNYLSYFDHVFLRETTDLSELTLKIGGRYSHSLPDLAFLKKPRIWKPKKMIGVFLAQPMAKNKEYIDTIIKVLEHSSKFGNLKFIRFNYSKSKKEDDKFVQKDIQQILLAKGIHVDNDLSIYNTDQVIEMMSKFEFAICSRFHSHIFATISGCPFISITSTRKTELFMKEENLNFSGDIIDQFNQVWSQRVEISEKLQAISRKNHLYLQTKQVNNLLLQKSCRPKYAELDQNYIYESTKNLLFKLTGYDISSESKDISNIKEDDAVKIASYLCFQITKKIGSKYEWGTIQNIMSKPWELKNMIKWIVDDIKKDSEFNKLDLELYNQNDLNGLHRAGWQYVLAYLRILNNNKGIICDTFIDRTFVWGNFSLVQSGIIPYTNIWIGFVHHTPNQEYTKNNCWEMINSIEFIQSLPTCKGIICFSEYLSSWFKERFKELKVDVPVITLYHPTIFVDNKWDLSKIDWSNLNLINIGAWYRNPFSIYQINVPPGINKMTLKGSKMHEYFLSSPPNLNKSDILNLTIHKNKLIYYLCSYLQENFNLSEISDDYLQQIINEKLSSVTIIDKLSNNDYDSILSNSIVFLHLVDASAVNTVIECIVRETPVLVNRHPALEEYLGKEYPLFYDNLNQVYDLLQPDKITEAHLYLKNKDKNFLKIENFLSELIQSDIYQKIFNIY
jgi:polysaccharide pyruvyl transferase WcaK-like protein